MPLGLPLLRGRIAQHYKTYYGIDVAPERVCVTTGSSAGFLLGFLAAFEPGDRVGITAPGYPAYRHILSALGFLPVEIQVGPESGYQATVEVLENLKADLDGLIVASPGNPTGSMLSKDALKELCRHCQENGIRLISDEIYHGITYERRADSALEFSDEAIIVNSFSKYYSMTGWRIGWMVLPQNMVRTIECLQQNMFISAPTLSQFGAVAAFDCGHELDQNVARYRANRDLLIRELPKLGFDDFAPSEGAFYLYTDVSKWTQDSKAFCKDILEKVDVATTPGLDFDAERGKGFMRFSYAGATEHMQEALNRLKSYL